MLQRWMIVLYTNQQHIQATGTVGAAFTILDEPSLNSVFFTSL
jgi:hypothetical protein